MDCSPPGSSVHEIFQARILEWVAISYFRGSTQPRYQTYAKSDQIYTSDKDVVIGFTLLFKINKIYKIVVFKTLVAGNKSQWTFKRQETN